MRIPGTPIAPVVRAERVQAPEVTGNILALGLQAVGKMMEENRREKDNDAYVSAQNEYTKRMGEWTAKAESERVGNKAEGLLDDYASQHKDTVGELLQKHGMSHDVATAFRNWANGREAAGTGSIVRFTEGQKKLYAKDQHTLRVQSIFDQAAANPETFNDALQQLDESYATGIGQGLYRLEEAQALFGEDKKRLSATAFENLYSLDRKKAMSSMENFGMDPVMQAKAKKRYRADLRAEAAQARAWRADQVRSVTEGLEDTEYMASVTGDVAPLRATAEKLQKLGETKLAGKIAARADLLETHAAVIKESGALSLPELAGKVAELDKTLQETVLESRQDEADSAGIAKKHKGIARERELRVRILQERVSQLEKDPAAAVAVVASGDSAEETGSLRLAAQERNGVPYLARRVLTNSEATKIGEAWRGATTEERVALARNVGEQYGTHAYKALAESGLTAAEQLAVRGALLSPGQASFAAMQAVIAAANAKDSDLPQVEGADRAAKELWEDSKVISGYADIARRVMPGNAALQSSVRQLQNTAKNLYRMNGGDIEKTRMQLDGSLDTLTGDQYALVYNKDTVAGGVLEDALANALGRPLEGFLGLRAFASEKEKERYLTVMRRKAVWVNAADGDGFMLIDPAAQAPVTDEKGNVFRVREKDAPKLAAYRDPARRVVIHNIVTGEDE